MVLALHIVIYLRIVFQVTDCLYLARIHLHKHCRAPVGFRTLAHCTKLLLHYLLQSHIDGGEHVISLLGRLVLPQADAVGILCAACLAGLAIEHVVEGTLKSA